MKIALLSGNSAPNGHAPHGCREKVSVAGKPHFAACALFRTAALFCTAAICCATETRSWTQSDYADFQKGVRTHLSIRSDGRLSLAPTMSELFDSATAYLWTLAHDSHGNLYAAGGPGARLFRIPPHGKGEKIADFDALEIHAIAIDSNDRIYVGTAPDGKVYRVDGRKSTLFYDPKQKYIWAMLCDPEGNLFIATGDQGEVHRVTPDGKGKVFFKTDETHVRSMAFDGGGNLLAGTEPGGLVIRISPAGEGFVVYQMAKREVTALAVGPKNEIYAAAVGSKNAVKLPTSSPAIPPPAAPPAGAGGPTAALTVTPQVAGAQAAQAAVIAPATVPGGSDVYVIPPKQSPERIWTGAQDVVYSLALDPRGRLLIASGNKGNLYRVETRSLYLTLETFPVEQVTMLLPAKDGTLFAATGNVGKVFRIGPGLESEGTIESDVFDSGGFAGWGRIQPSGELNGGQIELRARSGNLDRPQKNWSAWSPPVSGLDGGRVQAPPARFLQWKATLTSAGASASPTLDSVDAAYLRQNIAPRIEQIEVTPYNYRFPAPTAQLTLSSEATLSLPAMGSRPPAMRLGRESSSYPSMTYQKGALGVRWMASDENGDSLIYTVEIRGAKEKSWKPLRDRVHEKYFSFDSTAFADGEYVIRITASDALSNTPEETLTTQEESDPFTIDNTPPAISHLEAAGNAVKWHAADALNTIVKAEYSLDGGDWTVVDPVGQLSDSQELDYALTLKNLAPGEHTVAVRVSDANDNTAVEKTPVTSR
jgi:sugar lactone lactonase YvrE